MSYIRGIMLSFIMFSTRVSIFISLVVFALLGNLVTAEKAFVITAYYNILRNTMTLYFPEGLVTVAETLASVKRIQRFMLYDEKSKVPLAEYMATTDTSHQNDTYTTGMNDNNKKEYIRSKSTGVQVGFPYNIKLIKNSLCSFFIII